MKTGDKFYHEFQVTKIIYESFISVYKDDNPLHTNDTFAKAKGFKECVVHGNILNGFLSFFVGKNLPIKNTILLSQSIKYCKPVYIGNTLKFESEIAHYSESVNVVEFSFLFKNENSTIVAKGTFQIGII